jgi:elongation factor Ts
MAIDAKKVKELREKTGAGFLDVKKALEVKKGDIEKAIEYLREQGAAKAIKKEGRIAAEGLTNVLVKANDAVIVEVNCETDFVGMNKQFIKMIDDISKTILTAKPKNMDEALKLKIGKVDMAKLIIDTAAVIGEKLSFRRFEIVTKKADQTFGNYVHAGGKISSLLVIDGKDAELAKDISMHVAAMGPTYISMENIDKKTVDSETKIIKEQMKDEKKPQEILDKMLVGRLNKTLGELTLTGQTFVKDSSKKVGKLLTEKKSAVKAMIRYEVGQGIEVDKKDFAAEVAEQLKK